MKKAIVLALSLMAAGHVFAAPATVCKGDGSQPVGTTLTNGQQMYNIIAGMYVVNSFSVKCSQNTEVSTDENAVAFVIGSLSLKGKNIFEGSSAGGAIKVARPCSGTCAVGNESTNLATLLSQATM